MPTLGGSRTEVHEDGTASREQHACEHAVWLAIDAHCAANTRSNVSR